MQRTFLVLFCFLSCHLIFSSEHTAQKTMVINGKQVSCIIVSTEKEQQEVERLKKDSPSFPITPIGHDKYGHLVYVVGAAQKSE